MSGVFDISAGTIRIHSGTQGGAYWYFEWTSSKLAALRGNWHIGFLVNTKSSGSSVLPTVQPLMTGPDGSYFVGGMSTYTDPSSSQPRAELYRIEMVTDMAVECLQVTDRIV